LRSFQRQISEFNDRGIRIAAICVDPPERNLRQCQKLAFTFPLLADTKAEVIRRYGVLHAGGGPHRSDIARPAEFLIDAGGTIRWRNLTESVIVRARPGQVLHAFDLEVSSGHRQ
jgi:peroxiredoxin